ncbi:MAG: phenylalanine--tRNA ligase subunit alpha [Armatimonadetes bacterium]|nr:MAG: phenylalanine--tRNA ligase subunit alpha [Armatimonadota bacterium]
MTISLGEPMDALQTLLNDAPERIDRAMTIAELDALENDLVGRTSPIASARRMLGQIKDGAERGATGKRINDIATQIQAMIDARRSDVETAEESERLVNDAVDVTLPGRRPRRGTHHLIQSTIDEIVDIFVGLGYTVATGPEAETEFYNFTALNIPRTHPSRAESDTLYLDYGDEEDEILLRTHTSPMQARYMEQHDPPTYVVVPGRVFRADAIDATHSPVFSQLEGLAVDEGITLGDLKGTLASFAKQFFGSDTQVKFIPHYFPFTEPSAEMHAYTDGRWIELLGCGMVNPAVFEHVGYDPERYTGFAFGMGMERMAMVRHGIADLRTLLDADRRVLEQYR